jgi:nucleotide-binding universal stress UspA family protein
MEEADEMKRIVVGLDATASSLHAFETALEWAKIGGAELETISVEELPVAETPEAIAAVWQAEEDGLRAVLQRVRDEAGRAGVAVSSHVRTGNPAKAVTSFLDERPCDLLVIGGSRHGTFVGALTNSAALGLIHEARCPVLVVPPA